MSATNPPSVRRLARRAATLAAVAGLFLTSACGGGSSTAGGSSDAAGKAQQKVALLFDGQVDDHAWNQAGFQAVQALKGKGWDVAYSEKVEQAAQVETFRNYAQQGYSMIIGTGGDFSDSAAQAAKQFPNVKFVVVNGANVDKNLGSVSLNYSEMGYIAGAYASGLTQSKTIGFVGGVNVPIVQQANEGFAAGAKAFTPDIATKSTIIGDWADVDKAREASLAMIGQGADVLWYVLDAAQVGLMGAAEDRHVHAIASYFDQKQVAPTAQSGLVTVDVANLIEEAANQAPQNQRVTLGVENGVIGLNPADGAPQPAVDNLDKSIQDIKNGTVTF
jgi:basic membrane protein A and related proteins